MLPGPDGFSGTWLSGVQRGQPRSSSGAPAGRCAGPAPPPAARPAPAMSTRGEVTDEIAPSTGGRSTHERCQRSPWSSGAAPAGPRPAAPGPALGDPASVRPRCSPSPRVRGGASARSWPRGCRVT